MRKLLCSLICCCGPFISAQNNPQISFFNEQKGADLAILFADTTLVPQLQELHAEIRMGMLDLSPERAQVLRELNAAQIPVVAWLLLPEEQGYWFHSGNADEAVKRYMEIRDWAKDQGIEFSGIGIDLELDMQDINLFKDHKFQLLTKIIGRLYAKSEFESAREAYRRLIQSIRDDGYSIESYYVPFIRQESLDGRTALQQATGFMDLETDKDIPMLYTSFMGNPFGTLKVMALDKNLKYVALGSTGGGFDPSMPSMTWDDLAYDLRLASRTAEEVHIFCLEAAIEKGFLPRLIGFDFDAPIPEYPDQVAPVEYLGQNVMRVSTVLNYPTVFLGVTTLLLIAVLLGLFVLIRWPIRKLFR